MAHILLFHFLLIAIQNKGIQFPTMKILAYIEKNTSPSQRLESALKSAATDAEFIIVRSITDLKNRLGIFPSFKPSIIVLLAENIGKLRKLFDLQSLFHDVRIILILQDDALHTLALANQLYPRFVSFTDSDFSDVRLVIEKMIRMTAIERGVE
jgi:hypothetical protein